MTISHSSVFGQTARLDILIFKKINWLQKHVWSKRFTLARNWKPLNLLDAPGSDLCVQAQEAFHSSHDESFHFWTRCEHCWPKCQLYLRYLMWGSPQDFCNIYGLRCVCVGAGGLTPPVGVTPWLVLLPKCPHVDGTPQWTNSVFSHLGCAPLMLLSV